ncbi:nucleoside-diphosphate kinase [uncultured Cetobacterium sp.]|uniref:nucleoside-diphosphate kinase n=1 Tax=uncultured Cetobacterium sp. TaxID=527638 RepID=UPI0026128E10|nr:nucleoside-diphosphate kinase [uncultured Cetobacterium sp.]
MEKTLLIIKPDGVKRKLIGEIIQRVEKKGLEIKELQMKRLTLNEVEKHYEMHKEKDFYKDLIEFLMSGPIVLIIVEGENAIEIIRKMAGKTDPKESDFGTIRGDFSINILENIVHTSDSRENAKKEILNFFNI